MKALSRLSIIVATVAASMAITCSAAFAASTLVYADECGGPQDAAWANATPWNTHYTTGELEYYDPADVSFADGMMTLKSEKRSMNGYSYTSGIATTLNRTKFTYGYFEIRAKLPKGPGIWPAFWLTNDSTLEIDVLEMLGDRPSRIYQTYHRNVKQVYQGVKDGPDYSAGYHTYAVDWQPTYIKWYIDGELTSTYTGSIPSDPMWICLNTAVGGAWPGSPTAETSFPVNYNIDYVHVYTSKPSSTNAEAVPQAMADSYSVPNSTALEVGAPGVLSNDAGYGNTLTALLTASPAHGTVTLNSNGSFTYTPEAGYTGPDAFSYKALNGDIASDATSVELLVAAPAPATPTVIARPHVSRKRHTKSVIGFSGAVKLGTAATGVLATDTAQVTASSAAGAVNGTMLLVEVQRRSHGAWHSYCSVLKTKPSSKYKVVVGLRSGKFRARAQVISSDIPAGDSTWSKNFRIH